MIEKLKVRQRFQQANHPTKSGLILSQHRLPFGSVTRDQAGPTLEDHPFAAENLARGGLILNRHHTRLTDPPQIGSVGGQMAGEDIEVPLFIDLFIAGIQPEILVLTAWVLVQLGGDGFGNPAPGADVINRADNQGQRALGGVGRMVISRENRLLFAAL